jgi:uncharacterized protein (DUF2384 family)
MIPRPNAMLAGRLLYVAFLLRDLYTAEEFMGFAKSSQKILGDRVPMDLCKTHEGFQEVCDAAQAIADGAFV